MSATPTGIDQGVPVISQIGSEPAPTDSDTLRALPLAVMLTVFALVATATPRFVVSPGGVVVLRVEVGLLVAVLLLTARRRWPAILVIAWLVEALTEVTVADMTSVGSLATATAMAGQAAVTAWLLQRASQARFVLDTVRQVIRLFVLGSVLPSALFALVPVLVKIVTGNGDPRIAFVSWSISSALGVAVVMPLVMEWAQRPLAKLAAMPWRHRLEFGSALVTVGVVMWFAFTTSNPAGPDLARFAYLAFPLVVWVAVRLGVAETSAALAVMVPIAVATDIFDPLYETYPDAALASTVVLQSFLLFVAAVGYTLAAMEHQRAESAVREQASLEASAAGEERFRSLFHSSPVPLRLVDLRPVKAFLAQHTDEDGDALAGLAAAGIEPREVLGLGLVTELNQASAELMALQREELLGPLSDQPTVMSGDTAAADAVVEAIALGKPEVAITGQLVRGDGGSRHVQVKVIIPYAAGRPDYSRAVVAMIDVTDVEEARRRAEELSALKSRLIATVAHELRTPLTAVVGFAELLEVARPSMPAPEVDEMVSDIALASRQMAAIVEDLLTSARADLGTLAVKPKEVDLQREVAAALRTTVIEGRDVAVEGEPAVAMADAGRFRQIVRNLVTNAVRHGVDPIRLTTSVRDGQAVLQVSDAGPTITGATRDRLFDLYWWGAEAGGTSLGIGLNLSRELARMMGGDLGYDRCGDRNVFELTLPAAVVPTLDPTG